LIGDEPCIAVQSMSGWPLKKALHRAMMASVGAAARPSHPATPGAARPPPPQVAPSWRTTTGAIDTSVMPVLVATTPPDALLVAALWRAIKPLIGSPEAVQSARI